MSNTGRWVCPGCETVNNADREFCVICGDKRVDNPVSDTDFILPKKGYDSDAGDDLVHNSAVGVGKRILSYETRDTFSDYSDTSRVKIKMPGNAPAMDESAPIITMPEEPAATPVVRVNEPENHIAVRDDDRRPHDMEPHKSDVVSVKPKSRGAKRAVGVLLALIGTAAVAMAGLFIWKNGYIVKPNNLLQDQAQVSSEDGTSPPSVNTPSGTAAPAQTQAQTTAVATAGYTYNFDMNDFAIHLFTLMNNERSDNSLSPLIIDNNLASVAKMSVELQHEGKFNDQAIWAQVPDDYNAKALIMQDSFNAAGFDNEYDAAKAFIEMNTGEDSVIYSENLTNCCIYIKNNPEGTYQVSIFFASLNS